MIQNILSIFKHTDIYNKDKFKSGNIKIVCICGYAGSGKTTLSNKLEGLNGVKVFHLDNLIDYAKLSLSELTSKDHLILKFFSIYKSPFTNNSKSCYMYEVRRMYYNFMKFILNYSENSSTIFVLEGVNSVDPFTKPFGIKHFRDYFDKSVIDDKVMFVFIKKSHILSSIMGAYRNSKNEHSLINKIKLFKKNFIRLIKYKKTKIKILRLKKILNKERGSYD